MATDVNLGMLSLEELRRLLGQSQLANPYSQMGVSPYQQIMSQMTPTMNPYTGSGVAIAGYDPALYKRMSGSGFINAGAAGGGGGGGGGMGGGSGLPSGPIAPTTPEEFAAQSARNQQINDFLTSIAKNSLTGLVFSGLNTMFGKQTPAPVEDVGTYFGKNPINDFGFATQAEADAINAAQNAQSMQSMQDALAADTAASQSVSDQSSAGSEAGGYGTGDTSGGFGEGQYNMGGPVDRVGGPNPPGPDDGAGMLQLGEYVIKKSAVKKYGTGLLDMINDGKIPAKKMKSLLG